VSPVYSWLWCGCGTDYKTRVEQTSGRRITAAPRSKPGVVTIEKFELGTVDAAWMHRVVAHAGLLLFEFFYQTQQTSRQPDGKI